MDQRNRVGFTSLFQLHWLDVFAADLLMIQFNHTNKQKLL